MATNPDHITGTVKIRVTGPMKAVTVLMTALESLLTSRPGSEGEIRP